MDKRINRNEISLIKRFASIQKIIDDECKINDRILIFGSGLGAKYLLSCLDFSSYKIRLCDSNYEGEVLNGYVSYKPEQELFEWADRIIISAFSAYDEIYKILQKYDKASKVIDLKQNKDKPFYFGEFELNANKYYQKCIDETSMSLFKPEEVYGWYKASGIGQFWDSRRTIKDKCVDADIVADVSDHIVETDRYLELIDENDVVLEVGAGTGRLSRQLVNKCKNLIAVDTSDEMLKELRKKIPTVQTYVVDGIELPFDNNSFDKIISCELMCHLNNLEDFLVEHLRVVKTNGYIIHSIINRDHIKRVSEDPNVVDWYLGSEMPFINDRLISYNRKMLEDICNKIGGIKLEKMIPYDFFCKSTLAYGLLNRCDMNDMGRMYSYMSVCDLSSDVIRKFEKEIVSKLPEYYTSSNLAVFKKM